jgi:hypothetical protein
LPRKKLRNVKAARKTLRVRLKDHILRSLSGPGIREVQRFGIYNLPFSDIRLNVRAIFDRLTAGIYERRTSRGRMKFSGRKQVKF